MAKRLFKVRVCSRCSAPFVFNAAPYSWGAKREVPPRCRPCELEASARVDEARAAKKRSQIKGAMAARDRFAKRIAGRLLAEGGA